MRRMVLSIAVLSLVVASGEVGASEAAAAEPDWVAAGFVSSGIGTDDAETFQLLLLEELRGRFKVLLRPAPEERCDNPACARDLADRLGATHVVYGSVRTLGSDLLVRVGIYESASDGVIASDKMTVDRVEDLALAAERIARGMAEGGPAEDNAVLGEVVQREVAPPRRREGDHGFAMSLVGIAPLGSSYAGADFGMGLALGYWFETPSFVIQPSLGCRFSTNRDPREGGVYTEIPLEVAAYYVFLPTEVAPFLGGGLEVHYGWETNYITTSTQTRVIQEETVERRERDGFGVGVKIRAGALLLRTYTVRLAIWVDYGVGYQNQLDTDVPQSLTFGLGAIF